MKIKNTVILLLMIMTSCKNETTQEPLRFKDVNFFDEKLSQISEDPFLYIYCKFDECGEWGGHEENIKISKKNMKLFKLEYEKYSVNCDSMGQVFDGLGYLIQPKKELIFTKEIEMDNKDKQTIVDFASDMLISKFEENFPGHAGISLSISNSDSTFLIRTYGGKADHYLDLIDKLELGY